jgi:hypothetical protein
MVRSGTVGRFGSIALFLQALTGRLEFNLGTGDELAIVV